MSSEKRPPTFSTLVAPIQKFRWVHFPRNADLQGDFIYRVTPVFMNGSDQLSYGVARTAAVQLARETYPGVLNVAFTRGFISSQAFVDYYVEHGPLNTLLPEDAKDGLSFVPTHPDTGSALSWMGFEAYRELIEVLDGALADVTAEVGLVAYDLNLPDIVDRLVRLGSRARVIIDNSDEHHGSGAAEDKAETALVAAGVQVKRQKMGKLQHNKTVYVDGAAMKAAIGGSTNMSWRGLFVQSNNMLCIRTQRAVSIFKQAFDTYWDAPSTFKKSASAEWMGLGLAEIDARITFSPHSASNSVLKSVADDIRSATSSIFYSLAFLANTPGVIRNALGDQTGRNELFVTGISDQKAGVVVASSSSNSPPTYVAALDGNAPSPFREEPSGLAKGGLGTRMHHKFIVMDFDQPSARVYLGSYNMSQAADGDNGENLIVVRDKRVATSYMIEAIRIIDHYQFRVLSKKLGKGLKLKKPPRSPGETPWWDRDYKDPGKIKDRMLFCP